MLTSVSNACLVLCDANAAIGMKREVMPQLLEFSCS